MEDFCEHPSYLKYENFDSDIRRFFVNVSKYCIKSGIGDQELAERVINYESLYILGYNYSRGLRALITAIKHLSNPNMMKITKERLFPLVEGYVNNQLCFRVSYNTELPDMYVLREGCDSLGVDKELVMSLNEIKSHLLDTVARLKLLITKVRIRYDRDRVRDAYIQGKGMVWNTSKVVKTSMDNIVFNPVKKIKPIQKVDLKTFGKNKWECGDCLMQNDYGEEKCIACGAERK